LFDGKRPENEVLADWLQQNLGMPWTDSVQTGGQLGGYDPDTGQPASEGFEIRNPAGFRTHEGPLPVAPNEFNNLFKLVRGAHVQTDTHWTQHWRPAPLADYHTYGWHGYEYLSRS